MLKQIAPRYWGTYFGHTMEGGYTAGYYSYIWAEVLDCCSHRTNFEDSMVFYQMGILEALAEYADAVLVVAKQNYILAEDINDVLDSFREHHSDVLGVVLNGARSFSSLSVVGHYGRYGRYGKYNNYGKR